MNSSQQSVKFDLKIYLSFYGPLVLHNRMDLYISFLIISHIFKK